LTSTFARPSREIGGAPVRVALLTEGGYPYAHGQSAAWCDRLLRGLAGHEFEVCALSRSGQQAAGPHLAPPPNLVRLRTVPLWGAPPAGRGGPAGRCTGRLGRRIAECFGELAGSLCDGRALADRFTTGLYGLAGLAVRHGGAGLSDWLRGEQAVRVLETACRAPGTPRVVRAARVPDLLAVADRLERALRPLSLDDGLARAALCHAVGGGLATLPGLLARRFFGTPLLVTEHRVGLREHYLRHLVPVPDAPPDAPPHGSSHGSSHGGAYEGAHAVAPTVAGAPVRALLAAFQARLAREAYARAALITAGNAQARSWQERCGAEPARLRTVYPGTETGPFQAVAERGRDAGQRLVWVGPVEPGRDLAGMLLAHRIIRNAEPTARLLIAGTGRPDARYLAQCRALAARLFPEGVTVTFTEVGSDEAPTLAEAYAAGGVAVLSSAVEEFPVPLVESMLCARATVSTDVGAVCEVIGGTGLVVPPRDPKALADACLALLRDPARRARLGAAARARALELFTVERNVAAFGGIYLELCLERGPGGPAAAGENVPFARPAETRLRPGPPAPPSPRWARPAVGATGRRERP
jgi:glycosyltransferase involved in cell wall biosynthesis